MAPCVLHRVDHYFSLYLKSLAQKLTEKMHFFVKFIYVTICDLHGHRRSQVKNKGVITVIPKITFMTSRDRKCV